MPTRRALSIDDLRKLVYKTAEEPERFGMSGVERHLLYRFVIETGLRRGEIRRLRRADFDFDAKTLEATQKARTIAVLPDSSLPERQRAAAAGTDGREILSESYSHSGQKRTMADDSGKATVNGVSEPALSDNGDGLNWFPKPEVASSNLAGRIRETTFSTIRPCVYAHLAVIALASICGRGLQSEI